MIGSELIGESIKSFLESRPPRHLGCLCIKLLGMRSLLYQRPGLVSTKESQAGKVVNTREVNDLNALQSRYNLNGKIATISLVPRDFARGCHSRHAIRMIGMVSVRRGTRRADGRVTVGYHRSRRKVGRVVGVDRIE